MKKRLTRLLSTKGMTLVELIVAMFLTSVILAIALGMLVSVKNLTNTVNSNAHMDTISSTVGEYIRGTVQTATSLKFFKSENKISNFSEFKDDITSFLSNTDSKAIAVLNIGTDKTPMYRIYEFNKILSFDDLKYNIDLAQTEPNKLEKEFGVFREAFYENTSCAVELYQTDGNRLQVASQCFRDDKAINQKHALSFRMLNYKLTSYEGIDGNGVETELDYTEQLTGHCYLILYIAP